MNDEKIYIFGHKHPDTDSICASIAYADLKCKQGYNAEARRLGELNGETAFILDYFGVPVPQMLETVKTQVRDLNIDTIEKISPNTSLKRAWNIMENSESRTLPVVDDDEKLLGVVSLSNITEKYMDVFNYNIISTSGTMIENICDTLDADITVGTRDWFKSTGKVFVATERPEHLAEYVDRGDIVLLGDRDENQKEAIRLGANCLVITCGHKPAADTIALAEKNKTLVLSTPLDTFTAARLINQSIPVSSVMRKNEGGTIVKVHDYDFIENIRELMIKNRYRSYPVLDENERVCGFISRFHLISQRKKKVILVDHNEKSQTCPGIEEAEILEIIDHHKLGDMTTTTPILFKNEPVGSTSTMIANMYADQGRRPSVQIAGLLCAAIISDTLKFQSPTCTDVDRRTAAKLASISGINIDEFAKKMFTAGSDIKGKSAQDVFLQDFKRVSFNDYCCGVSQITVLNVSDIEEERSKVLEFMDQTAVRDGYDLLALMITELSSRTTELYVDGKLSEAVIKELSPENDGKKVKFDRLMSRKKDIIPLIDTVIEKINL